MQIGIIGCGVAGQAAALALARDGHEVTVVERFAAARPLGAGLLLQPTGLEALDRLDLRQRAVDTGAPVHALDGRTVRGRRVLDLHYAPTQHGVGIHRAALFDLLHKAMLNSGVTLRLGFENAAIETLEHPRLIDASGAAEGPFDLVVNCAGAHDAVRAPLYPWGALWATCPDRNGTFANALHQRYDGAHLMIGILPIGRVPHAPYAGDHVAFFWSLKLSDVASHEAAGLDTLKRRVLAAWPQSEPIVAEITDWEALSLATYRDVRMRPWSKGRILTIGDAAHGTSPQLGQGANLALIDAVTLAHCLRTERSIDDALRRYECLRRPHVNFYQLASRALTPAYQSDSKAMAWLRDIVLSNAGRIPGAQTLMRTTLSGSRIWPLGSWRMPV